MKNDALGAEMLHFFGHGPKPAEEARASGARLRVVRKFAPLDAVEVSQDELVALIGAMPFSLAPEFTTVALGHLVDAARKRGLTATADALAGLSTAAPALYRVVDQQGQVFKEPPRKVDSAAAAEGEALEAEMVKFFGVEEV